MMRWSWGSAVGLALLFGLDGRSAAEESYRVSGVQLQCLLTHSQQYTPNSSGLIIIAIELCPTIVSDPMSAITVDTDPNLKLAANKLDRLLVLKKSELECLSGKHVDPSQPIYDLFPERCIIKPERK
jgi:hypothetical protein